MSPEELKEISDRLEGRPPQEALRWAIEEFFPDIALACSFGAEDIVLVDMIMKIRPGVKVFYLDTDVLFKETYELIDRVVARYGIQPVAYKSELTLEEQADKHGPQLWQRDPDLCCYLRKVEPLTRALEGLRAWITGIRRDQAPTRAKAGIVEMDNKFGLVKVNPLAPWSWEQVLSYIREHQLPYNPLHDQGYPSIGCHPCTRPVKPGEDPRSGRWAGFAKTECGLHGGAK